MIAVFAYAFPHRKTQDFLTEIALAGHRDVTVFGAPFQQLKHGDPTRYWTTCLSTAPARGTPEICARLGFDYVACRHDDVELIRERVQEDGLTIGIVAGARILKRDVIEAFSGGIVNFHPGAIPETSGLDAFFYTIKKVVDAGVTTHLIDPRVDAGQFLAFDTVIINPDDTPETVQAKGYQLQIVALRRFLADLEVGALQPIPIDRPASNTPMTPEDKWQVLGQFSAWRAARYVAQSADRLLNAAAAGETKEVTRILSEMPNLVDTRHPKGWTPLIMAAFNQHLETVRALLEKGADADACGAKGTTVLMYAKTALMDQTDPDTTLLDVLIVAGADVTRCDMYGRNIESYVAHSPKLLSYFRDRRNYYGIC